MLHTYVHLAYVGLARLRTSSRLRTVSDLRTYTRPMARTVTEKCIVDAASLGPSPFPLIVCGCGGKGLAKSLSLARRRAGMQARVLECN